MEKSTMDSNQHQANKYGEMTEELFEMEDDLNLFNLVIDDTYFWERIRFQIHQEILSSLDLLSGNKFRPNLKLYMKYGKNIIKNILLKNPLMVSSHEILFYGAPRRKKIDDGTYWDIYSDPILNELNLDYVLYEKPFNGEHFQPQETSNVKYLDLIFLAEIGKKLGTVSVNFSKKEKNYIKKIENQINNRFSTNINLSKKIRDTIKTKKLLVPFYTAVLEKVNPKLVLIVTSYGYGKKSFIEVCKSLNIPVIELQHGVIHKYHLAYSFPNQKLVKYFPDYLFTFGDYWKEAIDFPISGKKIYPVGYPFLEMEKGGKYEGIEKKNQILFISQSSIGEKLSKTATNFAKNNLDYDIVYKIHPNRYESWEKHYPWLKNSNIHVIDNDEVPLYELFAESEIQVGVYSTAIYEGLNFDLKTFLIDLPGIESMTPLIKASKAKVVNDAKELYNMIKQENTTDRVDPDYFFKPNAIENIRSALDEIMSDID